MMRKSFLSLTWVTQSKFTWKAIPDLFQMAVPIYTPRKIQQLKLPSNFDLFMRRLAFLAAASLVFTAISSSPSAFANPHNFVEALRKCDEACSQNFKNSDDVWKCMECCCPFCSTTDGGESRDGRGKPRRKRMLKACSRSCTNPHDRIKRCSGR